MGYSGINYQRQRLLSSSAQLLHATWLSLLEDQIVEIFLYGSEILGYEKIES